MPHSETWTLQASEDLLKITQFTMELWGKSIVRRFEKDVKRTIERIKIYPNSFPESRSLPHTRKAIVNQHVSLYYQLIEGHLFILRLYPNRQDPKDLA